MNDFYGQIFKYLEGKLNKQEKEQFEKELEKNSVLKREYHLQKDIMRAVSEEEVMNLREKLQDITSKGDEKNVLTIRTGLRKVMALAAGILLLVGVASWYYFTQMYTNPYKLYAQYYEPYENIYSSRSLEVTFADESVVRDAFLAYETESWKKAEEYFDRLLAENSPKINILFYAGIVKLEQDKNAQAIGLFKEVIGKENPLFTEQACWYTALAYLKIDKTEEARYYLNLIIEKGMSKQEEAKSILKKI